MSKPMKLCIHCKSYQGGECTKRWPSPVDGDPVRLPDITARTAQWACGPDAIMFEARADRCPALFGTSKDVRCLKLAGHDGAHRGYNGECWYGFDDQIVTPTEARDCSTCAADRHSELCHECYNAQQPSAQNCPLCGKKAQVHVNNSRAACSDGGCVMSFGHAWSDCPSLETWNRLRLEPMDKKST